MEVPWEYACWRATRYSQGAVKPWEWDDSEIKRDWMDYGLMSESVENELQSEEFAKKNPKARQPYHQATFNHD